MNITLGNREIQLQISKKSRKTISIKISDKGEIIVSSPLHITNAKIHELLKTKEKWIVSKLDELEIVRRESHKVTDGIKYLGKVYPLSIANNEKGKLELIFDNEKFYIRTSEIKEELLRQAIISWYISRCREVFQHRIKYYSETLKVYPKRIAIKDQKTRWGSCSSRGNINLNYRIIMAPLKVIDYLIVHELCHLVHMNHSKEFWNLVGETLPNYEEYRRWLKVNGNNLVI
jgi:predicted metal-dependent hydrolase